MSTIDDSTSLLLEMIGTDVLRSFVSIVVETFGVAIYTVLIIKATAILLHKNRRRGKINATMLFIILALYIMRLTLWIIDIHNVVTELNITLLSSRSPESLDERYARTSQMQLRLGLVEDVLYAYMVLLGDAIMFWRVYAFWHTGKERLMLILPCLVLLGTFVLTILVNFCAGHSDANLEFGEFTHPPFCLNIQIVAYWFQFCTAIVATALIWLKSWTFRKMIKPLLGKEIKTSPVYRVMTILVDSGIFYMLFFGAEAILSFNSFNVAVAKHAGLSFAMQIYQFQTSSIVGMYPTLIVVLMHTKLTLVDDQGKTTHLTSIRFDRQQPRQQQKQQQRLALEAQSASETLGWSENMSTDAESPADSKHDNGEVGVVMDVHALGFSAMMDQRPAVLGLHRGESNDGFGSVEKVSSLLKTSST